MSQNEIINDINNINEMDDYNTFKTKEEIEAEFKHLAFLHQHDIKNNDDTIFSDSILNGSFETTYIIRTTDETFISFPHITYLVKNLSDFWLFYDAHKNTSNILIESRLVNYIAYATIKYGEDLLIYDAYTCKIKSIYYFCSDFFHIQTNELTINQIKQLFFMYLLICVYAKQLNISWNVNNLIKHIKYNDYNIYIMHDCNVNVFSLIINYIRIQSKTNINSKNVLNIVKYFNDSFSKNAYTTKHAPEIKEWDLNDVSGYEFYIAMTVLKNNNFFVL